MCKYETLFRYDQAGKKQKNIRRVTILFLSRHQHPVLVIEIIFND